MRKHLFWFGAIVVLILAAVAIFYRDRIPTVVIPGTNDEDSFADTIIEGFTLTTFADDLGGARDMIRDDVGNILVSIPSEGSVKSVSPDGSVRTLLRGLNKPHGLAMRCVEGCTLYVAETDAIVAYTFENGEVTSEATTLVDLPGGGFHSTRSLTFLPSPDDNVLLVSIGSSCNACDESDDRRATIMAFEVEDKDEPYLQPFATGLRNSVFMALHPATGDVWATEMGRDFLGDDLPPDEINIIREGGDYGWPICYGQNINDRDVDKNVYIQDPCNDKIAAHIDLPAHVAPLGIAFIPEEGWPEEWWYDAVVSYHGSWNSSTPVGYKVVRIPLDAEGNQTGPIVDLFTGFLDEEGEAIGRPVDLLIEPGGTIYISDDKAGKIYKAVAQQEESTTYNDLIRVTNLSEGDTIKSPLTLSGEARGNWYFEASFPIRLYDADGNELAVAVAQAQGDWMTTEYVPFKTTLTFDPPSTPTGTIVLQKDNPSGLPEYDDAFRINVQFGPSADGRADCKPTGCSSQVCSDEDRVTTCEYRAEYACYQSATCERQSNGECGWTTTTKLLTCLEEAALSTPEEIIY